MSAAFFSPSHASIWSLSHHAASIPAMITCRLFGSNWGRFISWMSARMKSSSAVADFVRISRFVAARNASLRPISSSTIAGLVSIAADPAPGGAQRGLFVRERRDEVATVEYGLQRVPNQRIGFPQGPEQACPARWRSQHRGDVDEEPARPPRPSAAGSSAATPRARGASSGRSSSADDRRRRRRGSAGRPPREWGTA